VSTSKLLQEEFTSLTAEQKNQLICPGRLQLVWLL